jgi:hypothetical protein
VITCGSRADDEQIIRQAWKAAQIFQLDVGRPDAAIR